MPSDWQRSQRRQRGKQRQKRNNLQRGNAMKKLEVYDTTLRDGAQSEDISFSVEDKLRITEKLDELGVHFIEGGIPGSNPKDVAYFREARKLRLRKARISAFGSTRKKGIKASRDSNLRTLI